SLERFAAPPPQLLSLSAPARWKRRRTQRDERTWIAQVEIARGRSTSDTYNVMDGDTGSGSARPDERGSAVTSGDATKLAELVLLWSETASLCWRGRLGF
ncbi:unnamed protein product, partial [Ectocarpus sp. 12 AP-2014]